MAIVSEQQKPPVVRRIWKTPLTPVAWFWLVLSILLYGGVYLWYLAGLKTVQYPGPYNDPFRLFGIIAFILVLIVAAYSLRRRFVRVLPGSVQSWLWLHTWFGIIAILIALLHENYLYILNMSISSIRLSMFIEGNGGTSALYALILLVLTGVVGRLLDIWLARIIAGEASSNGIGIIQAVEARIHELDLLLERLYAGKSVEFKQYCMQASKHSLSQPQIMQGEQGDFQQAYEVLSKRATLQHSLQRQKGARRIIRWWRYIHITLACGTLGVVSLHSVLELVKMVLQFLSRG